MVNGIKKTDKLVFDLNMLQVDFDEQKKALLRHQIAEKYGVPVKNVEVNFTPITVNAEGERISLASDIITSIQDPRFQQTLMETYLKNQGLEDKKTLQKILEIDDKINTFINFDVYSNFGNYKIKYLKWSNYLSYGPDNYFDFTKLKGLVLLNGMPENQCGKTTFAVDLLRFALYGKSPKCPVLNSAFNSYLPEATEVKIEVGLEINGCDYVVRRTVTRPALKKRTAKSKAKQQVEYFRYINNNYDLIENCEAENVASTNNIIRDTIGTVEDFNLVISATSRTLSNLLELGQTDRSRLFSRWLGLLSIEEKERVAKDYYKNQIVPHQHKYDRTTMEQERKDFAAVIAANDKNIITAQQLLNEANERLSSINEEKHKIISDRREVKAELQNVDVTTLDNTIQAQNDELTIKRNQMAALRVEYDQLKDVKYSVTEHTSLQNQVIAIEQENAVYRERIGALKQENARINTLIQSGICPSCNQPIDVLSKTQDINANEAKIQEYISKGVTNKTRQDQVKADIAKCEQQRLDVEKLERLKLKMVAVKTQIDNIKYQIDKLTKTKAEVEQNRENILHNNQIDTKTRIVDEKLKVEQGVKDRQIATIASLQKENEQYENEITKRDGWIKILTEEEEVRKTWELYLELIGKNGIVKLALRKALPVINNEIARLLNGLCDFDVNIVINNDNNVCMEMTHDGVKLDLTTASSGFEGTIASLALRCALANIASMAKPNCLTLDEVLGGISADNAENIIKLYRRALSNYDFILHICHDTTLVDYHDQIVTVSKKDNVSVIEMTK